MNGKTNINRRQFIIGSGGLLLGLPFLSSLAPKALAQISPRRFIGIFSGHGQAIAHWLPTNDSVSFSNVQGYKNVRGMNLNNIRSGGVNQISRILDSSFNSFRKDLLLLTRLTPPTGDGQHHTSQMLGGSVTNNNHNTIDQLMAKASNITAGTPQPVLNLLVNESGNYYSNHSMIRRDGKDVTSLFANPQLAFDKLFCQQSEEGTTNSPNDNSPDYNKKVVDRVLASYNKIMNHRRISQDDRVVFQNYIDQMNDLENRLFPEKSTTNTNGSVSYSGCPTKPNFISLPLKGNVGMGQLIQNNIDVLCLAIKSGATNLATLQLHPHDYHATNYGDIHPDLNKDPHGEIGHSNGESRWRLNHYFGQQVLRILQQLNEVENTNTGETFLYNSLVFWGNDQGCSNQPGIHGHMNMPVLLAGQLGGQLKTGRLIDYGPAYGSGVNIVAPDTYGVNGYQDGRPYNQLLVTIMQAMGMSPSQYETTPGSGFAPYGDENKWKISGETNDGVSNKQDWLPGVRGESFS